MKLVIKDSIITVVEGGTLIQNDKTPCNVEFVFSGIWADARTKTVLFKAGDAGEVDISLDNGNECLIPEECLKEGGVNLKVCVHGVGDTKELMTEWCLLGRILYDATIDTGGGFNPPDPGTYDELKEDIGDMSALRTESNDLVGAINELKEAIDNGGGGSGGDPGTVANADVDAMLDKVFGSNP